MPLEKPIKLLEDLCLLSPLSFLEADVLTWKEFLEKGLKL
jgi:hypothetical protein